MTKKDEEKQISSIKQAYVKALKDNVNFNGTTMTGYEALGKAMVAAAIKGNVRAAAELAHILGEDVQRIQVDAPQIVIADFGDTPTQHGTWADENGQIAAD